MLKLKDGYLAIRQLDSATGIGKINTYEVKDSGCNEYPPGTLVKVEKSMANTDGELGISYVDKYGEIYIIKREQVYGTSEK
ncbi:MAG TPA: hypothetical protein ENG87_04520 [Candidatus Pacearchaeota archaeon]|nr:hypothetical protein [Candidatus Pacearchaeota archaeon]